MNDEKEIREEIDKVEFIDRAAIAAMQGYIACGKYDEVPDDRGASWSYFAAVSLWNEKQKVNPNL